MGGRMKPKPLKGKLYWGDEPTEIYTKGDLPTDEFEVLVVKKEDIASAVAWLKDRVDYFESEFADFKLAREFKIMIDEAFQDTVEKEQTNNGWDK